MILTPTVYSLVLMDYPETLESLAFDDISICYWIQIRYSAASVPEAFCSFCLPPRFEWGGLRGQVDTTPTSRRQKGRHSSFTARSKTKGSGQVVELRGELGQGLGRNT